MLEGVVGPTPNLCDYGFCMSYEAASIFNFAVLKNF